MKPSKCTISGKKSNTQLTSHVANPAFAQDSTTGSVIQGHVGMKLTASQVVRTCSGRLTTPFPAFKANITAKLLKAVDAWLMANALVEVTARGDRFNALWLAQAFDKPSQSDKDSAELLLFAFNPITPMP